MTNRPNGTLYVGVTANLPERVAAHQAGYGSAFTSRYRLFRLVYAEPHSNMNSAIQREKNIKHWPRAWKTRLVVADNPDWMDLSTSLPVR